MQLAKTRSVFINGWDSSRVIGMKLYLE
jgi:hypothetical protein